MLDRRRRDVKFFKGIQGDVPHLLALFIKIIKVLKA
jgi:hypothetical protein